MNIEQIPFNELLGIKTTKEPFVLELEASVRMTNHLGMVHASAQLALAEATSGQILISHFGKSSIDTLAVVRRVEAKFKSPLSGRIMSRSHVSNNDLQEFSETLSAKHRAMISIPVDVLDESEAIGLAATIQWFAQKSQPASLPEEN